MRRFEGYGVLITGAARGIGAATARRIAQEGGRVLLADVDGPAAEETARVLREEGADAWGLACDVASRAAVEAVVAATVERFGRLDVLVNNAASCGVDAALVEEESDEVWERDLDITLSGAFRCARAAMPHLAASGRGAIVSIGSVNGEVSFGNHAYSAAKAGLASLTRTLAEHAAPRGVRVNLVAPGTVRTAVWAGREQQLEALRALYPLGRIGEPEDIAAAVAFLASADASWVTGTTLRVDGGILAVSPAFREATRS
ncbi:SDR family oxidoreductase [Streptomyces sp. TRM66268-LWL]|uniref:SDR family oxidoreductase n=1 Tax=Streptomyces polyasparticus TaxID=2767826 RepID=A0ABR7SIY3_9ACTN|nr:SDR family NAD(P)-dependent oxidoreductase [Streptomyces polyasparticus]MBC9715219.1 SDR family oxidoreductase [Streptomyces polyasparticus]